jgi:hypothetical protein
VDPVIPVPMIKTSVSEYEFNKGGIATDSRFMACMAKPLQRTTSTKLRLVIAMLSAANKSKAGLQCVLVVGLFAHYFDFDEQNFGGKKCKAKQIQRGVWSVRYAINAFRSTPT